MSDKPENPPAYMPGMTLRDYFAGQALVGLLNGVEVKKTAYNKPSFEGTDNDKRNPEWLIPAAARDAYLIADSMLKVRQS